MKRDRTDEFSWITNTRRFFKIITPSFKKIGKFLKSALGLTFSPFYLFGDLWDYCKIGIGRYIGISLIIPVIVTFFTIIGWILNILGPNANLWEFYKNYYYAGELLVGMDAWRVQLVLFIIIFLMSPKD
jgi:hypothetical protein